MKHLISLALLFGTGATAATAQEPVLANVITPHMLEELERDYPMAAVECLRESLPKALGAGATYFFTTDPRLGQLWLLSFASYEDSSIPVYICTPEGLADDPKKMLGAIFAGRMGLPF